MPIKQTTKQTKESEQLSVDSWSIGCLFGWLLGWVDSYFLLILLPHSYIFVFAHNTLFVLFFVSSRIIITFFILICIFLQNLRICDLYCILYMYIIDVYVFINEWFQKRADDMTHTHSRTYNEEAKKNDLKKNGKSS